MNLPNLLQQQTEVIESLFSNPILWTEHMHYREDSPSYEPVILYNDEIICNILDNILDVEDAVCVDYTVRPLGPKGKVGIPYIITNQWDNTELIVKLTKLSNVYSKYLVIPPTSLDAIDTQAAKHCLTNVNLNNIRYIASDEFTNETLIAYVLNYIMKDRLLPQLF